MSSASLNIEDLRRIYRNKDLLEINEIPIDVIQLISNYLGEEKKDIHETNSEYLKNSYYNALNLAKQYGWTIVSCETDGVLKNIEEINEDIIKKLSEKGVLYE